jgi:hypothetical protein
MKIEMEYLMIKSKKILNHFLRLQILVCVAVSNASTKAYSATVIVTKPSTAEVKIDEGTDAGVTVGNKVCISDLSGKKITCGKVTKEFPAFSIVKVSKKRIDLIKKGMAAAVESAPAKVSAEVSSTAPATQPATSKRQTAKPKTPAQNSADHRRNFKLGYIYSAVTPNAYNKVYFNPGPEQDADAYETAWQTKKTSGVPFGGFLSFSLGAFDTHWMDFGLRYRNHKISGILTNYVNRGIYNSNYVTTSMDMTALGTYFDYGFWRYATPSNNFGFGLSSGLDIDMAKINLDAKRENSTDVAELESTLSLLSLRLGMVADIVAVQPFGITAGLNILVPVAEFGKKNAATVTSDSLTTERIGNEDERANDLITSLNHQKNSFGLEVVVSTFITF